LEKVVTTGIEPATPTVQDPPQGLPKSLFFPEVFDNFTLIFRCCKPSQKNPLFLRGRAVHSGSDTVHYRILLGCSFAFPRLAIGKRIARILTAHIGRPDTHPKMAQTLARHSDIRLSDG
jgi:hypothetical protein